MSGLFPLALPEGTILAGQYIIQKTLGQGGFGITYMALDHKSGGRVAVKEFFPDTLATRLQNTVSSYPGERGESFEYGKQCFLQEAETLAQFIGSENIVRIHSYFEENGTAYFVMDFVEGISFDEYIRQKGGKIPYADAERILLPVMNALALVHSKGIVHRDVTPDNIYITNEGAVKLLDFGAARYSLGDKSRSLDVVLKHGFAPKEQYTRHGKQGPFTDVYTVGASFYYAITGRRPPDSIDRLEEDDLIPPSSLGVAIAPQKEDAILKAMSVQPGERFRTMTEFAQALSSGEPQPEPRQVQVEQRFFAAPEPQTVVQPAMPQSQMGAQPVIPQSQMGAQSIDSPAQAGQEKKEIHCIQCGARIRPGIRYCTTCGADQTADEAGSADRKRSRIPFLKTPGRFSLSRGKGRIIAAVLLFAALFIFIGTKSALSNRWKKNILMNDNPLEQVTDATSINYKVLGSDLPRSEVTAIVITDTLRGMPEDAWDVSSRGNGRVMAWTSASKDGVILYIGGRGGVSLNQYSDSLFQGYENLESFSFLDDDGVPVLHTDDVRTMRSMFRGCGKLRKLSFNDAGRDSLNLSQVEDMSGMFAGCASLQSIDLFCFASLDHVKDFQGMFDGCSSLAEVTGFPKNSTATNLSYMFRNCSNLTGCIRTIPYTAENLHAMYAGCANLSESPLLLPDHIPASADVLGMFYGCSEVIQRVLENSGVLSDLTQEQKDSLLAAPGTAESGADKSETAQDDELEDGQSSERGESQDAAQSFVWDETLGEAPMILLPPPAEQFLEASWEEAEPYVDVMTDSFAVNNMKNETCRAYLEADNSYFAIPNALKRMGGDAVVEDVTAHAVFSPDGDSLTFVNGQDGCVYMVTGLADETDGDIVTGKLLGFAGEGDERYQIMTYYIFDDYAYVWAADGNGENGRLCRFLLTEEDDALNAALTGWIDIESPKQVTFVNGYVYYARTEEDGKDAIYKAPAGGNWDSPQSACNYVDGVSVRELLTDGERLYAWEKLDNPDLSGDFGWDVLDLTNDEIIAGYAFDSTALDNYDVSVYNGYLYFICEGDDGNSGVQRVPALENGSFETLFSDNGYIMTGLSVNDLGWAAAVSVCGWGESDLKFYDIKIDPEDNSYDVDKLFTTTNNYEK